MAAEGRGTDEHGGDPRADEGRDWQRLDKWLWCARFLKARASCTRLVEQGSIRINRQPTAKPHARLRIGDVLTFPIGNRVLVLRVRMLAPRRGPAAEARQLYEEIDEPVAEATASCTPANSSAYPRRLPGFSPRRGQ